MDRFREFIDANEYGNSPVEPVIDVSSIAQEDPLNDADASMTETTRRNKCAFPRTRYCDWIHPQRLQQIKIHTRSC